METSTTTPVELLKTLISIPSVNPMGQEVTGDIYYETAVTKWLAQVFEERNIPYKIQEVTPGRSNIVAAFHNPKATHTIMLDAHQDTVPVEGMTIPPFEGVEKAGRIYGRGACDVKGGMAAMLSAFLRITEQPVDTASNVLLSCSCDEEATLGGIQHLVDHWSPNTSPASTAEELLSKQPDLAIIAEPTELDVINAHKGVVRWKIITRGRACHSSAPQEGTNAIYHMAKLLALLEKYAEDLRLNGASHHLCGAATLSVGLVKGGSSVNIVADYCEIEVDRRVIPGETGTDAREDLIQYLKTNLDFEIEHSEPWVNVLPLSEENNEALTTGLLSTIENIAGSKEAVAVPFGTHASPVAATGTPAVVFGPGSIDQAHTKDEWIDIKQLEQATEVYYQFCTQSV